MIIVVTVVVNLAIGLLSLESFSLSRVVFGVAVSVALGMAFGMVGGAAGGVVDGVAFSASGGVVVGMAVGVAFIAGVLRLPFYVVEWIWLAALRGVNPATALRHSPALWDELLILPQPRLAEVLQAVLQDNPDEGLRTCGQISCNPFQRWAVQRALSQWLTANPDQIFNAFYIQYHRPQPYRTSGFGNPDECRRMKQMDFATQLIIGELAGWSPIPGFSDRLARVSTAWLRDRKPSPLKALTLAYYELIENEEWNSDYLKAFEPFRAYQHGEETYQIFRTLDNFIKRNSLAAISTADSEIILWRYDVDNPVWPSTIDAVTQLAIVMSHYVRTYRSATTEVGKRDALINAGLTLDAVRNLTAQIKSPERVLIIRVVEQWTDIIKAEQAILSAPHEVHHIRNMYLIGRPVQPDSGHPFVGRKDQFEFIKNLWRDATLKSPIIVHGQRRMGKTSILFHLEKNLGPQYVTVYANLQSLAAVNSTAAFVYNLCDEIQRRLRKAQLEIAEPMLGDFASEPFTGLRHFLNQVEDRLGDERWLVLLLDEFEMIEEKIKAGVIHPDVLFQLRNAMLNRPRFAVVLAGLHTLDQMTRDYWSPFFSGARNVKVSYLDDDAAETLITNPWDGFELEYDRDAIQFIAEVTGRQPTLLQSVCSALIENANTRLAKAGPQYHPRVALGDVDAALKNVLETSTYFDAMWKELDSNERLVLSGLAEAQSKGNMFVARADVNAKVHAALSVAEIERACESLKQRDMIDVDNNDRLRFHVELVRQWVVGNQHLP